MSKLYWLSVKDKQTGYPLIEIPDPNMLRNFYYGCGKCCYEHVNWFRYLEGQHPLTKKTFDSQISYEGDSHLINSVLFVREMIKKHYDLNTFELKEHL